MGYKENADTIESLHDENEKLKSQTEEIQKLRNKIEKLEAEKEQLQNMSENFKDMNNIILVKKKCYDKLFNWALTQVMDFENSNIKSHEDFFKNLETQLGKIEAFEKKQLEKLLGKLEEEIEKIQKKKDEELEKPEKAEKKCEAKTETIEFIKGDLKNLGIREETIRKTT